MKYCNIGILAHVDAGKTTLTESLLHETKSIRNLGKVNTKNSFLDYDEMERERGITIFSKQARLVYKDLEITLLDTPGHVDFSTEMERTLQVLDYAILLISAEKGVQPHTKMIWNLLTKYKIPTFVFINKMDRLNATLISHIDELNSLLGEGFVAFDDEKFYEKIAMLHEELLECFLEKESITKELMKQMIKERIIFPCFFGSALKEIGVREFLEAIYEYMEERKVKDSLGVKVFKITQNDKKERLTHILLTGGTLKTKDLLGGEKIHQIRYYHGDKYEVVDTIKAGQIATLVGLNNSKIGQGYGCEEKGNSYYIEPLVAYKICYENNISISDLLQNLYQIEEEEPSLQIQFVEERKEIQVRIMGDIQLEVLKRIMLDRFQMSIWFEEGSITYKETCTQESKSSFIIDEHDKYVEIHLLIIPKPTGSGIEIYSNCKEKEVAKQYQNIILETLIDRNLKGILVGGALTDLEIVLEKATIHGKHVENEDIRCAAYQALRSGLYRENSKILEPYYQYKLEIKEEFVGRAIYDLEQKKATFSIEQLNAEYVMLQGELPVATLKDYAIQLKSYTLGEGKLELQFSQYAPCHNEEEVIEAIGYYMPTELKEKESLGEKKQKKKVGNKNQVTSEDEIEAMMKQLFYANSKKEFLPHKGITKENKGKREIVYCNTNDHVKATKRREECLLVDGYNIIFAWDTLKELAMMNLDGARGVLLDVLSNYQGIKGMEIIVVFDAYRVKGGIEKEEIYQNLKVIFTKEAETADQFIERFSHVQKKKYDITVATSDHLEQIIITGQGAKLLSAKGLYEEIERSNQILREKYNIKEDTM
ncbi:MAG: NYN domain-containing protein [Lachnospiraceae bacterium]